ncbi:MAG TPA: hypothetical protein VGE72_18915 [Azospirillum sp.]
MTALTVYWDTDGVVPELAGGDWLIVSAHLAHAGIGAEVADSPHPRSVAP